MTQLRRGVAAVMLALGVASVSAENSPECAKTNFIGVLFTQTECTTQDGVTVSQFLGTAPSSPYATEFDRRAFAFAVARGQNTESVRRVAGIVKGFRGAATTQSFLSPPPSQAQIARRDASGAARSHHQWIVMFERVQYAAQGGVPGFVIDCATAIRSNRSETVEAAECFPLEERKRFFRTLDAIR